MIERTEGGLSVTVPMVIANARTLLETGRLLLDTRGQQPAASVVDLQAVGEVDSSALGVVLGWLRTAGERDLVGLRIANPPASLISLATLYGVSELLPLA
ncbi:Anti-sigma-factor antagonist [Candidatus Accumulibacter aalborgensis]|uniref:Anti-sigma-factor antagonist n=1 Tax=Candidatus Accumulibacter aalborgensis TaxID=1860102 RepID=A0A1A8XW37_9PROT|nr:STAS domain-containing protein [Candidatus Accumulibacter aalborgensis]SBT09230.1 Anti-sigma-factor antagonist [Candidatus Accumulibacter aalborgensis]